MTSSDPIALLFGGLEKLGPGANTETLHVLGLLPKRRFRMVVDAGCGTGRQTLVLAKDLRVTVNAVDSYEPFLTDLQNRAQAAKLDSLVKTHCMDMKDIPEVFQGIDLLWSEGAAYNIGFQNALMTWREAMVNDGLVVVSELSWLKEEAPDAVEEFFRTSYPDMRSVQQNIAVAKAAGYKLLTTYTLPRNSWVEGYYDLLTPRAKDLLDHRDATVREFAIETVREIEVFELSEDSYGYVFYVLQRV